MAVELEPAVLELTDVGEREDVVLVPVGPCAAVRRLDHQKDNLWGGRDRRAGLSWIGGRWGPY